MTKRWQLPKEKRQQVDEEERLLFVALKDLEDTVARKRAAIEALEQQCITLNTRLGQTHKALLQLEKEYPES